MSMKKVFISLALISFLAAACAQITLKHDVPSSPKESYEELPK